MNPTSRAALIFGFVLGALLPASQALAAKPRAVAQPTGDFAHTPVPAQEAGVPIPVYLEYPGDTKLSRVTVKYKGSQMSDWKRVDLKPMGAGYGGLIPCEAVTIGTARYWIVGFDENGDPVATGGDVNQSYSVAVKEHVTGEAPHLPGQPPVTRCEPATAEPPQVAPPLVISQAGPGEPEPAASAEPASSQVFARLWFGISGAFDIAPMPGARDACLVTPSGASANGFYCTNPDGSDYPSRSSPAQSMPVSGEAGVVNGGLRLGDVRPLFDFDYALSQNLLLGARLGYLLNDYPGQAAVKDGRAFGSRLHLEARATYVFGSEPLGSVGFAPTVFAGLGLAEFDVHTTTLVGVPGSVGQQPEVAWQTAGPFFVVLGGGGRYQLSQRVAAVGDLRVNWAVGSSSLVTFGPEIAVLYGF